MEAATTSEESDAALQVYETSLTAAAEKRDRVAAFIRTVDARAEYLKAEEERLRERRKALENGRTRLMAYIASVMQAHGFKKLEGNTSAFTLAASPVRLVVEDERIIPPDYFVVPPPPPPVLDKAAVKAALEQGQDVPGARLERGQHVRMR